MRHAYLWEEGTEKNYTYLKESDFMTKFGPPTKEQLAKTKAFYATHRAPEDVVADPKVEALVEELIGRVADKWTMIILEVLVERGTLRFTQLSRLIGGISQKMLTQTVRQMERDGFLTRKVYPVVPPKVEYKITDLGLTLSAAFCGVWMWAEGNLRNVEKARSKFDKKARQPSSRF
jgi:DNA-binding HxlR family transcriptional regulator